MSFLLRTRVITQAASRAGAMRAAAARVPATAAVAVRMYAGKGSLEDRAHVLEERAARDHDQQALAALAKALEAKKKFGVAEVGTVGTREWRLFVTQAGARVSAWHDVPLTADAGAHNFVVEMPKGTDAKMEISLEEAHNPIKQDVKLGALRVITYGKSQWNYGSLPQTWEDSNVALAGTNFKGDGDPLDVVEIGGDKLARGSVVPVRVLGAIALIDEGEIDWKIVAIALNDPHAAKLKDIGDVDIVFPGKLAQVRDWYRLYKTADGKGENKYAFNGEFFDRAYTLKVIEECNRAWKVAKQPAKPAAAAATKKK